MTTLFRNRRLCLCSRKEPLGRIKVCESLLLAKTEIINREMDMIMLTLFNSRDREMGDWIKLFREADERYQDVKAWVPEGSTLAIIEAIWGG